MGGEHGKVPRGNSLLAAEYEFQNPALLPRTENGKVPIQ